MAHFLYISDVFCPWCYGFSKNIAKIKKKFALPFEVYAGALVEPAVDLEARVKQSPNVQAFIDKLYAATGVKISDDYVNMLFSGNAKNIFMDSKKAKPPVLCFETFQTGVCARNHGIFAVPVFIISVRIFSQKIPFILLLKPLRFPALIFSSICMMNNQKSPRMKKRKKALIF